MAVGRRADKPNDFLWKKTGDNSKDGRGGDDVGFRGHDNNTAWSGVGKDHVIGRHGDDGFEDDHGHHRQGNWRGDEHLEHGFGHDRLRGWRGDDHLEGGDGNDWLRGERGDDRLDGGGGDDWLSGGRGDDTLLGGADDDRLFGGRGDDWIDGEAGDDWLYGGRGDDTLLGGEGADFLHGGKGDDVLVGGNGADTLIGGLGADTFVYGPLLVTESAEPVEPNFINGNILPNRLVGGSGTDIINGDGSDDILTGGEGRDIFTYDSVHQAFGNEVITDFTAGVDGDILDFKKLFGSFIQPDDPDPLATLLNDAVALGFEDRDGGTLISVMSVGPGTNGELKPFVFLDGVESATLTRDNFQFGIDSDPVIDGKGTRTIEAPEGGDIIADFDIDWDLLDFRAVVQSLGVGDDPFGDGGIGVAQSDDDTVITVGGLEGSFITLTNVDADDLTDDNWIFA